MLSKLVGPMRRQIFYGRKLIEENMLIIALTSSQTEKKENFAVREREEG